MAACGRRRVIAYSARGSFCSTDVNLTVPSGGILRWQTEGHAFEGGSVTGPLSQSCFRNSITARWSSALSSRNRRMTSRESLRLVCDVALS